MLRWGSPAANLVNVGRSRTHYEVLGVERSATTIELRRAHRDLARMLHPDHLATVHLSDEDRVLAERRIREVNEAWRILGDPTRRARYDATLGDELPNVPWSPFPPGTPGDPEDWEHVAPRRSVRTGNVRVIRRPEAPAKPFHGGVLLALGLVVLVGVLLVVLLAGHGDGGVPPPSASTGSCVRIDPGPTSSVVPCSSPNDGRIVAFTGERSGCPSGAEVRRLAVEDTELACLVPDEGG